MHMSAGVHTNPLGAHILIIIIIIIIALKPALCKYPCRIIIAHHLPFSSLNCLQFFSSPLVHLSLPALLPLLRVLLSPCRTHLCTINLPTNELEPLTLSLPLSTAAVPYLCSIFLPLSSSLSLFFYCSIDRHVISYMNNARQRDKNSCTPSFSWLGFVLQ